MGITARQSPPPGTPGGFVEGPSKLDPKLSEQHLSLKPEERFRSSSRPGSPVRFANHQLQPPPVAGIPVEAPRVLTAYPSTRYHPFHAPAGMVVQSADHEAKVAPQGEGWVKSPSDFPPGPAPMSTGQKLELLDALMHALAEQATGDEEPLQVLDRLIVERDDFARKFAAASKSPKG